MATNKTAPASYQKFALQKAPNFSLSADQAYFSTNLVDSFPTLIYRSIVFISNFRRWLSRASKGHRAPTFGAADSDLGLPRESVVVYLVPDWASKCGSIQWQRWSLQQLVGRDKYLEADFQSLAKLGELIRDMRRDSLKGYLVIDSRLFLKRHTGLRYLKSLLGLRLLSIAAAENNFQFICWSMDNRDARFDLASSLITSENGVVHSQVCSPNKTLGLHTRQTGPGPWCLIPRDLSEAQQGSVREIDVYFGGLLYPNRAGILDRVAQGLEKQLVNYLYTSKNHVPWIEYLKILSRSKVVVHTSTYSENKRVTQFHNKAMEATQMGCLLIAQQTEELDEFFGPFEGYVPFTTADEAVQMCLDYLENTSERERISQHGHGLATSYATTLRPWPEIFDAIGVRRPPTAIS